MSKVTIDNLVYDYEGADGAREACDIEIVPRKIVEEIMKTCDYYMSDKFTIYEQGIAARIKTRAAFLLKQFEEDET